MQFKIQNVWNIGGIQKNPEKELELDEVERIFSSTNSFCWVSLTGGDIGWEFIARSIDERIPASKVFVCLLLII
jgi:hypothetical protein